MILDVVDLSIANAIPEEKKRLQSRHEDVDESLYLYIMILLGKVPLFISEYFLSALAMAGHMRSSSSC